MAFMFYSDGGMLAPEFIVGPNVGFTEYELLEIPERPKK
jgi:hypothetical protein